LSVTVGMLAWHRFSVDQISTSFFLALTHKMWFSSHRWTMKYSVVTVSEQETKTYDFSWIRLLPKLFFRCNFSDSAWFLPREAMLSAVYAVVMCLCVCLSVTLRYCIKTAKRRITQTMPHDSPMTLVFCCQRSWRNSNGITHYGGDKCRCGGLKLVTFDEKRAITRKRYKIDV